jgi:16S rRNA (guanine1207-N2)-methyltransferase
MRKNTRVSAPYQCKEVFQAQLGGQPVHFVSKPGLSNWDQVSPSMELIAENVDLPLEACILYFGFGHGAGVVALARQARHREFWLYDTNEIALWMAKQTFEINQINNVTICDAIDIPDPQKQTFDRVIVDLPKSRYLAQSWLLKAFDALKFGGHLYLAGSNSEGIQSVSKDAESLFGPPGILGYKKGNRIVRFVKNTFPIKQPAWALQPGIAPHSWHEMDVLIRDYSLKLYSLPGIFSYDRVDPGTYLLLEAVNIQAGSHLLDLGCGYGIIGLIASLSGAAQVDLVDVNLLATAAAQKNILSNGIKGATVIPSDVLQSVADRKYSHILTNPPFHSGKAVDYQMAQAFIEQSWQNLIPDGQFTLVANQFIRYDNIMKSFFRRTIKLADSNGYQVWQGIK